jgi:hypothetical protein
MKKTFQKIVSLLLTIVMFTGIMPISAAQTSENGITAGDNDFLEFDDWIANNTFAEPNPFATTSMMSINSIDSLGYGSNGKFIAEPQAIEFDSTPISNRVQLEAIGRTQLVAAAGAEQLKDYHLNGKYHLIADIYLSGVEWVPIGNNNQPFTGTFDGQGHVINNLTITGERQYSGLFGYINSATIKNVGLENTDINVSRSSSSSANAGGISGQVSSSTISNCYNTGNITVTSSYYGSYAGGISGSGGIISNCYNTGIISAYSSSSAPSSSLAGGISGSGDAISNCYNTGNISASSTNTNTP